MDFISALASEGVGYNNGTLTGLPAGTVIGGVGNTGYSFGEHLDLRVARNGSQVNPTELQRSPYGSYLQGDTNETDFARLLSNLPYDSISGHLGEPDPNYNDFWDRAWEYVNGDVDGRYDFYMELFQMYSGI